MSKFITNGNYAIFEYPPVEKPEFDINNGALWIFGYDLKLIGKTIRAAKRFEIPNIEKYIMVDVLSNIHIKPIPISQMIEKENPDINNSVLLKLI